MPKLFSFSFSKLESYERCPKNYAAINVTKTQPFTENEASRYGKEVHKRLEQRLINGQKLPLDLKHLEPFMAKLAKAPGEGMPEQKLALTRDLKPTGWFDDDVYMRSIADYIKINGNRILVIDHKTGARIAEDTTQVEMVMAMMFCYEPELEWGTGSYFWTKHKKFTTTGLLSRDDVQGIWSGILPRADRLEEAHAKSNFPSRQNFLCRRHCACTECPYWGV